MPWSVWFSNNSFLRIWFVYPSLMISMGILDVPTDDHYVYARTGFPENVDIATKIHLFSSNVKKCLQTYNLRQSVSLTAALY